jgi:helicase
MKTEDFPYLNFPFEEFNKPQSQAIQFAEEDCNIVVALNTSTGKTAVSMCFFAHEIATKDDTKCVYASPLKAISEERKDQFDSIEEWAHVPKLINTGDYMAQPEDFDNARLIMVTSETLDSKARNPKLHAPWMSKVGVLVVDEMHLLDEPVRGAALEIGLVNFSKINKDARIVGLSATMSNAKEIASWLKSLNGKKTYCVSSDWRPVVLKTHWTGVRKSRNRWDTEDSMVDQVTNIIRKNRDEKILVFVHSKRIGNYLIKFFAKKGLKSDFYHSGLKSDQRKFLESQFKSPISGLNILITTSALAMGVNL